ncbi:S9 family peptidase, partial [Ruminococcaceae bacterium OttesenSCG-928-L11]|nr:S9 family peptidase [Ruminococcaceae bacterium OttesenSCG-928-L11]
MRRLELNDFRSYSFLSGLRISPDGAQSVLSAAKANEKNGYDAHLYLLRNGETIRLTATAKEKLFIWDTADTVLFANERDPELQKRREEGMELTSFYRISTNGGEASEAFVLPVTATGIEKIDDGLYAVMAVVDCDRDDFSPVDRKKTPDAFSQKKKDSEKWHVVDEVPFWFNGAGFTNKTRHRLFVYNESSDTLTPVSDAAIDAMEMKIAPCKQWIAYTASRFENGVKCRFDDLYLYEIATGTSRLVLDNRLELSSIAYWNSKLVIAGTEAKNHGGNENPCFWMLDTKTDELTYFADYDNWIGTTVGSDSRMGGGHHFIVKGDKLYFNAAVVNNADLFTLDLHTGAIDRITGADGSFDFFDIADSGIQAVAFLDDRLQEVYQVNGTAYTRLTSFNESIHTEILYSKPEHHTITDPEGFVIDGWVIPPVEYQKGRQYPAILHIHGGPKTIQGDVYFHEMQLWAARGYFVLYCNPRGSDGKGNVFADIRGKYGTCDYDNIMQFTDEMLKAYPDMDSSRMGVTGGSYGGFMTNWIIGHTDRFKCAASQRSISNWISKANTTDIGYFFVEDQNQGDTWESHEKLWFHSPLKYADKCTTPTLFIHSDNDYRCWLPEGIQMFTALKMH